MLTNLALVAIGGAAGSMLRYLVSVASLAWLGAAFPWGTLIVNALGSFAIGVMAALDVEGGARLLLVTGLLGGFTTFSAYSLETAMLWEQRSPLIAGLYVLASVGIGLGACMLAYQLIRR